MLMNSKCGGPGGDNFAERFQFSMVMKPCTGQADWDDVAGTEGSKLKDAITVSPTHSP